MAARVQVLGRLGRKGRLSVFGAIATLAATMGIGVAVWSLLDAVLLHPVNLPNADRLVAVGSARPEQRAIQPTHTYEWYVAIKESASFEVVGASALATMSVRTSDVR